jgi:hypothetical protein
MRPYALSLAADMADDWQSAAPTYGEPADYCSKEGAASLKEKIEAYWRERGYEVMVAMHNVGFHPAIRAARYDVRSDMVNGMPRRAPASKPRPAEEVFVDDFDDSDIEFE